MTRRRKVIIGVIVGFLVLCCLCLGIGALLPDEETEPEAENAPVATNDFTAEPIPTTMAGSPPPLNSTSTATKTTTPTKTAVPATLTNTPRATRAASSTPRATTPRATNTAVPPTLAPATNTPLPPTLPPQPTAEPTQPPLPTAPPEPTQPPPPAPGNVVIVGVNKREEFVDIQNTGGTAQDLAGWVLLSELGNQSCGLGGVIEPGQVLRIWAMAEDAGQGGYNCGFGSNIWNNEEPDRAILYNAEGVEVSRW